MLETRRQQLFFADADMIPTLINTDVVCAAQRDAWVFLSDSLVPRQCKDVGVGRQKKGSVTRQSKRW